MDYTFKINDELKSCVSIGKNMQFGVTAGSAVIPDNVVISDTIKRIETVTKEWYDAHTPFPEDTLYIING